MRRSTLLLAAVALAARPLAAEPAGPSPSDAMPHEWSDPASAAAKGLVGRAGEGARLDGGELHSCVVTPSGGAVCWGENAYGQIGDGTMEDRPVPVAVKAPGGNGLLSGVTRVATGLEHSCALLAGGTVACWGSNAHGQLGQGMAGDDRPAPVLVPGLSNVTDVAAGGWNTCVLVADRTVRCWGANSDGQLGDGSSGTFEPAPVKVAGVAGAAAVAVGDYHSCALVEGGAVYCWGSNQYGQLGMGVSGAGEPVPVAVVDPDGAGLLGRAVEIAAGGSHSCARLASGEARCWGGNWDGQLGDGSTEDRAGPVPVLAPGGGETLGDLAALAAGEQHSCALTTAGEALCWGNNVFGQLGGGTPRNRALPAPLTGGPAPFVALAAGADHSCGVTAAGAIFCWGRTERGQSVAVPTPVQGTPGVMPATTIH